MLTASAPGLAFGADPTPVPAASSPAAAAAMAPMAPATNRQDPNQVICKREEVLGSRLGGKKVCRTREEWADIAALARTRTDRIEDTPRIPDRP
jgi:hypothetical protein